LLRRYYEKPTFCRQIYEFFIKRRSQLGNLTKTAGFCRFPAYFTGIRASFQDGTSNICDHLITPVAAEQLFVYNKINYLQTA